MPIINPDLSQVTSLGPISEGTYEGKITAVESATSKAGNPKVVVSLEITVDGATRQRQAHIVTSGAAAFQFEGLLRATGFEDIADKLRNKENVPFDTDWLVGQELLVQIVPDTYNGELRDKVQGFLQK